MQNAGAYLKSAREENGYSITEVSKNTKISPAVLRSLEDGRLDNIDPVYLKGFLKMYCRFLRVDWQEFTKEYPIATAAKHPHKPAGSGLPPDSQSHKPEGSGLPSDRQSHKPPNGIKNSLFSFILERKKIIIAGLSVVAGAFFMVLDLRGCILSNASSRKPATPLIPKRPSKTTAAPAQSAPGPIPSKTTAHPVSVQTPAPQEAKPKAITLVIRAKEESFIKVKVDGRTIYQGLLRKGNAESWSAKDNIELFVGNAAAVALEVDGKLFSSLGRKGQQLKNILINREGLKINP